MATSDDARVGWIEPVALARLPGPHAGEGTTVCSAEGVYSFVSRSAGEILGWQPAELTGRMVDEFVHPDDVAATQMARLAASSSSEGVVTAHRFRATNGNYRWIESTTRRVGDRGGPGQIFLSASVRVTANRKVVGTTGDQWTLTDPMTGIAPRTVFMDRLTQALDRLARHKSVVGVIYLDLDRFKTVNESRGHDLAEQLLVMVAERVLRSLRLTDTLARIGGDEFVVLAEGFADASQAARLAECICRRIEEPFHVGGDMVACTVSAGVATTDDWRESAEGLLQEADIALYSAKHRGRRRAELFDADLRFPGTKDKRMPRHIVVQGRLRVDYEPIVDLLTGQLVSFEPLARIEGPPELDFPETFVEVADESGRLVDIDEWVFARAVGQATRWRQHGGVEGFRGIAINVRPRHLAHPHFCQVTGDSPAEHGAPTVFDSPPQVKRTMEVFSSATNGTGIVGAVGVDIGPDDLGTSRCSLSLLNRFPLNFVKVDLAFVRCLTEATPQAAGVAAIIRLAHSLHLAVIAEGIETEDQVPVLERLGFDRGQGRLFGMVQSFSEDATLRVGGGLDPRDGLMDSSGPPSIQTCSAAPRTKCDS